ncbi:DDE-type integrase/transposase/recombinase [Streptomyces sp. NPDC088124]|uniref:DDE-type integrase/transposase/recombinase n=1 Tax=Streptomyces sp. NPDC088124 TaxID=3154654 RepID=UPI00343A164E
MKTRRGDFISEHAKTFGVQRICRVLQFSPSGYYRWTAGTLARAERQAADEALIAEIREIHTEHKEPTGSAASTPSSATLGRPSAASASSAPAWDRGPVSAATQAHHALGPARAACPGPRPLRFHCRTAGRVVRRHHIRQVGGSWLFLAGVLDIWSRRVIGWSMASYMRAELAIGALTMAVATRGGHVNGVIFHTDRGTQHTSAAFAQVCDGFGIRRSMGRIGSSYDNALAERFWQGLKREAMHQSLFSTLRQAGLEIFL